MCHINLFCASLLVRDIKLDVKIYIHIKENNNTAIVIEFINY